MNEQQEKQPVPRLTRNRDPRAKAFIRKMPRDMPAKEVVAAAAKEGMVFSVGLVWIERQRRRDSERESSRKRYNRIRKKDSNGHAAPNGHTKTARGGQRSDIQAALDLLVEAIRSEALDDLRKKLGS